MLFMRLTATEQWIAFGQSYSCVDWWGIPFFGALLSLEWWEWQSEEARNSIWGVAQYTTSHVYNPYLNNWGLIKITQPITQRVLAVVLQVRVTTTLLVPRSAPFRTVQRQVKKGSLVLSLLVWLLLLLKLLLLVLLLRWFCHLSCSCCCCCCRRHCRYPCCHGVCLSFLIQISHRFPFLVLADVVLVGYPCCFSSVKKILLLVILDGYPC